MAPFFKSAGRGRSRVSPSLSRDCANFVARVVPLVFVFPGRFVHVRTRVTLRRALFWKILTQGPEGAFYLELV